MGIGCHDLFVGLDREVCGSVGVGEMARDARAEGKCGLCGDRAFEVG